LACHREPNGRSYALMVKKTHRPAVLQTPASRTAKVITCIGHGVEDDHLQELEN